MAGDAWLQTRQRWLHSWVDRYGSDPTCQVCGAPWTLRRGHLHHRSYDRIGHERFGDLIPLDRQCHDRLHRILESTPAWRRMDRTQATDLIVAQLRRRNRDGPSQP
jgi:5-methylcytosine-specific restriction endonuclease McrA